MVVWKPRGDFLSQALAKEAHTWMNHGPLTGLTPKSDFCFVLPSVRPASTSLKMITREFALKLLAFLRVQSMEYTAGMWYGQQVVVCWIANQNRPYLPLTSLQE
jgi:hypothetical protein